MLADASYYWFESTRKLPINAVIEHVKNNDRFIAHFDVFVTKQLNKDLLNSV
jgi:hypothetical protein